ncbi:acyl-CoA dehydrogenase [Sphingomonas sp. CL5.1]|uniref:acyl-CoA dehydrogenase family protein n=1 Tax=Sphingomonas sp. CL5.1 TaxID=2653203 RepID=UPI001583546D|nr:acyl-CoA dehydrogenase family protein [Sphingomonas sp. CL5.1]QKS00799.1 acyl-CoA dehydrogenase [Sphingomonas sp. CL5.1]
MSEIATMLAESIERLLDARLDERTMRAARAGEWPDELWHALEEQGVPLALVPEEVGGFGLDPHDALELIRLFGRHAVPLPLGETMLANATLAEAGLPLADGPAALVPIDGAKRVAWGRHCRTFVVETPDGIVRVDGGATIEREGADLAGLPRDAMHFPQPDDAIPVAGRLVERGALVRVLQCAGALERVLELTVTHVSERVQFGRPLAKFQAVQQELAKLAGEVAAASAAADLAAETFLADPADAGFAIAVARVRIGEAVGRANGIAHQLHGAIGFTAEHRLHLFTTSLWAWRDEFGGATHWATLLGNRAFAAGKQGYWPMVTAA